MKRFACPNLVPFGVEIRQVVLSKKKTRGNMALKAEAIIDSESFFRFYSVISFDGVFPLRIKIFGGFNKSLPIVYLGPQLPEAKRCSKFRSPMVRNSLRQIVEIILQTNVFKTK